MNFDFLLLADTVIASQYTKKDLFLNNFEKLSDKQLAATAKDIAAEEKRRANLKAAASAILTVLKKHRLSVRDLADLDLGQKPATRAKKKTVGKKGRPAAAKKTSAKKSDKRAIVADKYKNPKGAEKWSGRGRAPKWVGDILAKKRISISQFKADKRYKI